MSIIRPFSLVQKAWQTQGEKFSDKRCVNRPDYLVPNTEQTYEQIQLAKQNAIELQNESEVNHSAEPASPSIDCGNTDYGKTAKIKCKPNMLNIVADMSHPLLGKSCDRGEEIIGRSPLQERYADMQSGREVIRETDKTLP
ncbi:hypothetical protein OUZ56_032770 [Daphnia magna]|uniref:Uncharacterized protein n=1 Tax=Daphnia magna TaxID=35525 RepID=A0ABQ9ZX28_9CRUS|nr:hypothetical protein OUZ56_032770 [Daphnia magna]